MNYQHSYGISLVGAIFLITVVALLTVALTRSVATSAAASSVDLTRMHALLAAETGAQLGAYAAIGPSLPSACTTRTVPLEQFGLPACQAVIDCRVEAVLGVNYFSIQSDGQCMDGVNLAAQRTILLRLKES